MIQWADMIYTEAAPETEMEETLSMILRILSILLPLQGKTLRDIFSTMNR